MYRLAIVSDVHADVHALSDALREIAPLGCDGVVCAGDLVDYGLFPDETLALLAERKIPTVRGNHDRWALDGNAEHGGGWDLSRASRRFLASLPASIKIEHEGVRVAVHHASPRGDMDGVYPEEIDFVLASDHLRQAQADVLVVGHTHVGFALNVDRVGLVVNPAALLRSPADDVDASRATATFGVLELPSRRFTVHRAADGREVEILRRHLAR